MSISFNRGVHGRISTPNRASRDRHRRMSFECFETRSMLSAAPTQVDPELFILVSGRLGNLNQEIPIIRTASFQPQFALANMASEGGFLSLNTSSLEVLGSSVTFANVDTAQGLSTSGRLDNSTWIGFTEHFNESVPLVTPTPIVSDTYVEPSHKDGLGPLAETSSPGGAIRIEPIVKSPADSHVGGPIALPPQKAEVGDSQIKRLTISALSTAPAGPVSGEWARAVVFETAGGEPLLARKSAVSTDVKLSITPRSESQESNTLSHVEMLTSLDADPQVVASQAGSALPKDAGSPARANPYASAISAAVDAFMSNWNNARADLSNFEGPALRITPAVRSHQRTESAGSKPTAPKDDEQAAARVESESEAHHAGMEAAPVLIALALERWLYRRAADQKKAGTIGIEG